MFLRTNIRVAVFIDDLGKPNGGIAKYCIVHVRGLDSLRCPTPPDPRRAQRAGPSPSREQEFAGTLLHTAG
jgi:hypothetical protein